MANFGLSRPWVAELDVEKRTYKNAFRCAEAVSTSVTPNYVSGSLYGDNQEVERVEEFRDATVAISVSRLPVQAAKIMLGHTVGTDGEETDGTEDASGYVGYGFIVRELINGKKKYRACFLHKVKFAEGEESYESKGDSIVIKAPSLNGTATGTSDGEWRKKSPLFDTEEKADQWIQTKIGVIEACMAPVAKPEGGKYQEAQTVELSSATQGAVIKYTVDGTTPGKDNGMEYSVPVEIGTTTGLRAVAYKEGAQISEVMAAEYFIGAAE